MQYKVKEKITTLPIGIIILFLAIQFLVLFIMFYLDGELPIFTIAMPIVMLIVGIFVIAKSRVPVIYVYDDKIVWHKTHTEKVTIDPKQITRKTVDQHNKVGCYETISDSYRKPNEVNLTRPYHETVKDKPKRFTYYIGNEKVLWFYSNMRNADKLEDFIDSNMQ